jgi:hypothetical protein
MNIKQVVTKANRERSDDSRVSALADIDDAFKHDKFLPTQMPSLLPQW